MPVVEESVFIARPPDVVFNYVVRPENFPVWDSSIVEAEQVGTDAMAIGTRFRGIAKVLGSRFDWTTEVTEFDPPRRVTSTSVEGALKFVVTSVLEPAEGGTQYTYRVDAESGLGGIFGRLSDPIVQRAQARTIRANLGTLAEMLAHESDA